MYYIDNNIIYSNDNLVYRNIYTQNFIENGFHDVIVSENKNMFNALFKINNIKILDLSKPEVYYRVCALIKKDDSNLFDLVTNTIILNHGVLYLNNNENYEHLLYNLVIKLKQYNVDGVYLPSMININNNFNRVSDHVYIL